MEKNFILILGLNVSQRIEKMAKKKQLINLALKKLVKKSDKMGCGQEKKKK